MSDKTLAVNEPGFIRVIQHYGKMFAALKVAEEAMREAGWDTAGDPFAYNTVREALDSVEEAE